MSRLMDAEPIIKDLDMFPIYSYMLSLDGIIWQILSIMMIILVYVSSWIFIQGVIVLKVQVMDYFMVLLLLIFIILLLLVLLDLERHGGLGFIKSKMVLAKEATINKLIKLTLRTWYRFMNEMWYCIKIIIIKIYLTNNRI
eukprot:117048_1